MIGSWVRRRGRDDVQAPAASYPDPDHAWKSLGLVNEWIRHSDAKAGVTLAFSGAIAALTFNLTKDLGSWTCPMSVTAVVACALLVVTVGLCAWTLTPRVRDKDEDADAKSLLFFASISADYKGNRRGYRSELGALAADPSRLTEQLADQVHANALVATVKYRSVTWAIRSAVAAGIAVAVLALIINISEKPSGGPDGRQLQDVQLHEQLRPDQGNPGPASGAVRGDG